MVERPQPTEEEPQHLCLDKGYVLQAGRQPDTVIGAHGSGEEKLDDSRQAVYRAPVLWKTLEHGSPSCVRLVRYDAANYLEVTAGMWASLTVPDVSSIGRERYLVGDAQRPPSGARQSESTMRGEATGHCPHGLAGLGVWKTSTRRLPGGLGSSWKRTSAGAQTSRA